MGDNTIIPKQKPTNLLSEQMSEVSLSPSGSVVTSDSILTSPSGSGSAMDSFKSIVSFDTSAGQKTDAALDLLKRGSKALFTKSDGKGGTVIDKAAVIGAVTAAASYAEAKALAADAGVDLTEEEYDESLRDEKKAEYAGYLQNFFGGKKDGGRIGFESGANEMIKTQLLEEIMPEQDGEEMIIIMTEEGPITVKKSVYESMPNMFMDTTTSIFGDAGRGRRIPEEFRADGGRIGFKFGTKPEEAEIGIMSIDVEAGDDDEDMMMAAGINFSRAEKSYLFRRLGGSGGADRSYTMPNLYRILSNPGRYPEDAAVLKEIAIMGLGKGRKDGGRIGFSDGSENFIAPPPKKITEFNKDMVTEFMAGNMPEFKGELMSENYTQGGVTDLDAIFKIYSMGGSYDDIRETLNSSLTDMELEKIIQSMIPKQENFYAETRAKGGRIGYKGGANRVSELLITRAGILAKDANADVSDIDAEIFQLTGKVFKSVGGIGDVPTGEMRKNNAGVIERDYRDKGGFVPVGIKERADDVPAMLSKNEFVMTADAVRGIGNGSVEEGSKKLYNTMKQAEKVGKA